MDQRSVLIAGSDDAKSESKRLGSVLALASNVTPRSACVHQLGGGFQRAVVNQDEAEAQGPLDEVIAGQDGFSEPFG